MNQITLSMLEIETCSEKYSFRDDGFVGDFKTHSLKVCEELNLHRFDTRSVLSNLDTAGGKFFTNPDTGEIVIFYISSDSMTNLFRRGHEETHALHIMGQFYLKVLLGNLTMEK